VSFFAASSELPVPCEGVPRDFPMQAYLFGDNQLGLTDDMKGEKYELMFNDAILQREKWYRLLNGKLIQVRGILYRPAPDERMPPGPSWDIFYYVGWENDPVPEGELLSLLESSRPVCEGNHQKARHDPRQARR
jgi:hypothetical protein